MFRLAVVGRRKNRSRAQRAVIALSVLLVAGHGVSTALLLRLSYVRMIDAARTALESTARSAAVGTAKVVIETDAMLVGIARILGTALGDRPPDAGSVTTVLRQFDAQSLAVSDILILDAKGRLVNSSVPAAHPAQNYALAPFFTAHHPGTPNALFIGAPKRDAATGAWSVMLSRPLTRSGRPAGVIAAEIPTAGFAEYYRAIAPDASLALLRDDGVLVAAQPGRASLVGRVPSFAGALPPHAVAKDAQAATEADPLDPAEQRVFHPVSGYPLIVSVSRSFGQLLPPWHRECSVALSGFACFAAAVAALGWVAVDALGRSGLAAARLNRSQARLRRQAALLQSTLESIEEGLSVFDRRGRLVAHNQRFTRLLELPTDLVAGASLADILRHQALRGDFGDIDAEAEAARRLDQFYRDVPVTKERVTHSRVLQIRRKAMPDGAVLSVYSDVTELKEGERKIIEARSQAEAANRAKGEFLANMSHELRTPLNAIIGFSEIICNELFGPVANERYLEYLRDILNSSQHLLSIIKDVLDMSKIEAGKLELAKEAVTLQRVIGETVRMMRERAESHGIALITDVAPNDIVLWADERALKQVLLNLLSNAIKFSGQGGTVTLRLAAEDDMRAVVEVEDRGIGMTIEEQERALLPFVQAKPVVTKEYEGTGLGLSITKGLVEAHGGTLTIRSRPGSGTTVRIALPIEAPPYPAELEGLGHAIARK